MRRAWLLALAVCVGLVWWDAAPAAAGGRHRLLGALFGPPSYAGNPIAVPIDPSAPPPYAGPGLRPPAYPWGYFGAQCTRPTVTWDTGYYGRYLQWGYQWGY